MITAMHSFSGIVLENAPKFVIFDSYYIGLTLCPAGTLADMYRSHIFVNELKTYLCLAFSLRCACTCVADM